jgi:TorA maturation chaperone TorD
VNSPEMWRLARLRQGLYEFLGSWFAPPEEAAPAPVLAAMRHLGADVDSARALSFYPAWDSFRSRLEDLPSADLLKLADVYTTLFDPYKGRVSLWQSGYVGPDAAAQGEVIAAVQQAYLRAGVRVSGPDPADHLAWELSFLSFLCGLEAEAWESQEVSLTRSLLEQERSFLSGHLCVWLPQLTTRLGRWDDTGLYREGALVAWALARHDCDFVPLLLAELHEAEHAG